jgi:hypothetical protein
MRLWGDAAEKRTLFDLAQMLVCDDASLRDPDMETLRTQLREHLLAEAVRGNRFAHEALYHAAAFLTDGGRPSPFWLTAYLLFVAMGKPSKRGPKPRANTVRDIAIACVTYVISQRHGLKPTRNIATETESGCSIVAEALKRLKVARMSEANVNTIWRHQRHYADQMHSAAADPSLLSLSERWKQWKQFGRPVSPTLADLLQGRLEPLQ